MRVCPHSNLVGLGDWKEGGAFHWDEEWACDHHLLPVLAVVYFYYSAVAVARCTHDQQKTTQMATSDFLLNTNVQS